MEDFDIFTDEIKFSSPVYTNIIEKFLEQTNLDHSGPNYQSSRKLRAEQYLASSDDIRATFNLSEAVSASLRILTVYREEQMKCLGDKLYKVTGAIKPTIDLINRKTEGKLDINDFLENEIDEMRNVLDKFEIDNTEPLYKRYLKFSSNNNAENFQRILKDLPREWTVVQLTAPYNPNENLIPQTEFRAEMSSIYVSVMTNDYFDEDSGPFTIQIPANVVKEGERPLFEELYSVLDENYKSISAAPRLANQRLIQTYWAKREDVDLRMKSVINVMDKEWLGEWKCLLTGKLLDSNLRDKIKTLLDNTTADWGFVRLTPKQRVLLYNLLDACQTLSPTEVKSGIRKILTEHGNPEDVREILRNSDCADCNADFRLLSDLCLKCLSKSFEAIHHFSLVNGIKAFSDAVTRIRENNEWAVLKEAKRHPLILIVDEVLDQFPWEMLRTSFTHPICRIENIHFLYYLYKRHEQNIVDGYFVTDSKKGRYVINPEKNLDRMEKRMKSFVQYWCPDWLGELSKPPAPDVFLRYLEEADIFLYCGHGDGCQYACGAKSGAGAGVEGVTGRAAALLSGCGSVRLVHSGGRAPPAAAHHHYHIAGSPLVVGMLWEVTDLEVDKVISTLLSLCVPSDAKVPWESVGKTQWSNGALDTTKAESQRPPRTERDVLRAIVKARRSSNYVMIASSVVARGLPARIEPPDNH